MQTLVDHHRQFVDNALMNRKPVEFTHDGRDVVELPGLCCDASCGVFVMKKDTLQCRANSDNVNAGRRALRIQSSRSKSFTWHFTVKLLATFMIVLSQCHAAAICYMFSTEYHVGQKN